MRAILITTLILCLFIASLLGITIFCGRENEIINNKTDATESQYGIYNNRLVLTINEQTHEYELWGEKPIKSSGADWDIFYVKHADCCHFCDSIKASRPIRNQEIINE